MRYALCSDIHANLPAFDAVVSAYQSEHIDQYFHAGDIVGYGAQPRECLELLRRLSIISVAGNHDWGAVDLFTLTFFNPVAAQAIEWTKKQIIDEDRQLLTALKLTFENEDFIVAHGTLANAQDFYYMLGFPAAAQTFALMRQPVCFVGHSHIPGVFIHYPDGRIFYTNEGELTIAKGFQYIVNLGSVGQPRDNNPAAAYCVYDTGMKKIWIKRAAYDLASARQKIIESGLPVSLGNRLFVGR